jgi:hypothetical protein
MPPTIVYVHGNGNRVREELLKSQWGALIGRDTGDRSCLPTLRSGSAARFSDQRGRTPPVSPFEAIALSKPEPIPAFIAAVHAEMLADPGHLHGLHSDQRLANRTVSASICAPFRCASQ